MQNARCWKPDGDPDGLFVSAGVSNRCRHKRSHLPGGGSRTICLIKDALAPRARARFIFFKSTESERTLFGLVFANATRPRRCYEDTFSSSIISTLNRLIQSAGASCR